MIGDLDGLLNRVPIEEKAKVFDELVREFQGKGRLVHTYRKYIPSSLSASDALVLGHEAYIKSYDVPVYDFVMRVDGHDDFAAAILKLANRKGDCT